MQKLWFLVVILFLVSCVVPSPLEVELETTAVGPVEVGSGFRRTVILNAIGATLYFEAYNPATGKELWKSDGTNAGTVLVKDIVPGPGDALPRGITEVNGTILFSVYKRIGGGPSSSVELWKTDGSAQGTVLVKVINPSDPTVQPISLITNVNGTAYFTADDGVHGDELWKSDGTTTGTRMVKDINPGAEGSRVYEPVHVNGTLYFPATKAGFGRELWKSDGTAAGTRMVRNINPNGDGVNYEIAAVGDTVFFAADNGVSGKELWKSDGTAAGTVLVKDVSSGGDSSYPESFIVLNDTLLYSAYDKPFPEKRKLWKSDGTAAGTVLLKDITLEGNITAAHFIMNATLYFAASDSTYGEELWKSDGSAQGTVLVRDIYPGAKSSSPYDLIGINNTLYFSARNETFGKEFWKSDGTTSGTRLVKDMNPGTSSSNFNQLTNLNGTLFFTLKQSGIPGYTLWKYVP
jgi:ELWxxDGT repeat protein